jgi:hypothetical protein
VYCIQRDIYIFILQFDRSWFASVGIFIFALEHCTPFELSERASGSDSSVSKVDRESRGGAAAGYDFFSLFAAAGRARTVLSQHWQNQRPAADRRQVVTSRALDPESFCKLYSDSGKLYKKFMRGVATSN